MTYGSQEKKFIDEEVEESFHQKEDLHSTEHKTVSLAGQETGASKTNMSSKKELQARVYSFVRNVAKVPFSSLPIRQKLKSNVVVWYLRINLIMLRSGNQIIRFLLFSSLMNLLLMNPCSLQYLSVVYCHLPSQRYSLLKNFRFTILQLSPLVTKQCLPYWVLNMLLVLVSVLAV